MKKYTLKGGPLDGLKLERDDKAEHLTFPLTLYQGNGNHAIYDLINGEYVFNGIFEVEKEGEKNDI